MIRILFDQGVPVPLRNFLDGHIVDTCYEKGWSAFSNGELVAKADAEFDIFVTTDKNLCYQQNLKQRNISIIVLPTTRWPLLRPFGQEFAKVVSELPNGCYLEWEFPC